MIDVRHGDSREVLKTFADASIDSCVTDPPYALVSIVKRFGADNAAAAKSNGASGVYKRASAGFMGQKWDTGETAFDPDFWAEVWRVLKPGAHLLAFSGTRTYHRMVCAIEDAGFEIRDQIGWAYGSGFPKSHDVSKAIDKAAGAVREVVGIASGARNGNGLNIDYGAYGSAETGKYNLTAPATPEAAQWQGFGTALKPAWEPVVVARKPFKGTIAANVMAHGTGALNIDGCRVAYESDSDKAAALSGDAFKRKNTSDKGWSLPWMEDSEKVSAMNAASKERAQAGRWPANLVLSYPADEYQLRDDVTAEQTRELYGWLHENA